MLETAITNRDGPAGVTADPFARVLSSNERCASERKIVLRVEYFVGCYAKGSGKNIHHIAKHTVEQLQTYNWHGNICECRTSWSRPSS